MIRKFKLIIAALALVVGGITVIAEPAAAHHTHSGYQLCSYIQRYYYPGWNLLETRTYYSSSGHPTVAACKFQLKVAPWTVRWRCYWFSSHAVYTGGAGVCIVGG